MHRQCNFARACGNSPFVPRLTPNVGISTRPEFKLDGGEYRLRRRLTRSGCVFVVKAHFPSPSYGDVALELEMHSGVEGEKRRPMKLLTADNVTLGFIGLGNMG